jgi:hypothetical protein
VSKPSKTRQFRNATVGKDTRAARERTLERRQVRTLKYAPAQTAQHPAYDDRER